MSSIRPGGMSPALLTRMSTSWQALPSVSTSEASPRSWRWTVTLTPCCLVSRSAASLSSLSLRAAMCRLQPSAAMYSAMTRPMPFEAPVIRTDLPFRLMSIECSLIEFEDFAGEGRADDFGRPAGDQVAARAPPHGLDRQLVREAGGAVELHAAVRGFEAELGAEDLRHEGVVPAGDALVGLPGGAVHQQLAGLIFGVEIGDCELHRLALGERLAEGHALLRELADHLEAALGDAEAVGRLVH